MAVVSKTIFYPFLFVNLVYLHGPRRYWNGKITSSMDEVKMLVPSQDHRRLKNRKSGWLTLWSLNHLSADCSRELANWRSFPPLGVQREPLNLYEARPKTVKDNLSPPSISSRYGKGACDLWIPERPVISLPIRKTNHHTQYLMLHSKRAVER